MYYCHHWLKTSKLLVHMLLHIKSFNYIETTYDYLTLNEVYGGESAVWCWGGMMNKSLFLFLLMIDSYLR